jgi:hypothetical protein
MSKVDSKLELVYYEVLLNIEKLLKNNHDPLEVAAVLTSQALGLYKSVLSDEEYNSVIENIVVKKDDIRSYEKRMIN